MKGVSRRYFLKFITYGISSLGIAQIPAVSAQNRPNRIYHGSNLTGWEVAVGDARFEAPGEPMISLTDIDTVHLRPESVLRANTQMRRIMAHNVTFKRFFDTDALDFIHRCRIQFRLPYIPSQTNGVGNIETRNAETFDIGLFVWDGANTVLDYGMAFSWLLNPWTLNFGNIRQWDGTGWVDGDYLPIDTNWHTAHITVNFAQRTTELTIDDRLYPSRFTQTVKPDFEGDTRMAARYQIEAISLFPGEGNGALHEMDVKNWQWRWDSNG